MHSTLKPNTNVFMMVIWSALLAGSLITAVRLPVLVTVLAFLAGVLAGLLQAKAMRLAAPQFRQSSSLIDVRKTMNSSRPGKLSVLLLWGTSLLLVVTAWPLRTPGALTPIVCGYAAFALAREIFSFPAVLALSRRS